MYCLYFSLWLNLLSQRVLVLYLCTTILKKRKQPIGNKASGFVFVFESLCQQNGYKNQVGDTGILPNDDAPRRAFMNRGMIMFLLICTVRVSQNADFFYYY